MRTLIRILTSLLACSSLLAQAMFFGGNVSGVVPYTFVQGNIGGHTASSSGDLSNSVAFGSNNTLGNVLIVSMIWAEPFAGATAPFTISDTLGNTWVKLPVQTELNNIATAIWVSTGCKAGANTVTVTGGGFSGSGYTSIVAIHEYSHLSAVDTSNSNSTTGASLTVSATAAQASELVLGVGSTGVYSSPVSPGSGTVRESLNYGAYPLSLVTFDALGTSGSNSVSATFSGSYSYLYIVLAK